MKFIHPDVQWEGNHKVDPFCYIGYGLDEHPEAKLVIGKNAVFRTHAVIYFGCKIQENFMTGHHVLIREFTEIGANVSIGTGSVIEHRVLIKNGVRIHSKVFIPEFSILEEDCWIGPGVVLTNAKYPRSINVKNSLKGPWIGARAIIGANVTILPGIQIGKGALIGAGSVVTKDVPEYAVVAGNPAKIINHLSHLPYAEFSHENTTG
jgi:acetyltransferase-like isoleucine patch superfamily enzyme